MPRPEDQHYVSAAYLRGFVADGQRALHVRRRAGTWFRQVPENLATRKNFYSILRDDKSWDDRLERFLDRRIEAPGFRALSLLKARLEIPSWADRERISLLIGMQYLRVPQWRQNVEIILQTFLEHFTRSMLRDQNRMASDLQVSEGLSPEAAIEQAAQLRDSFRAGHIQIRLRREAGLQYMFGLLADFAAIIE